ncbi:hypothetical protein [Aeromonas caviae]|uniref:hypothetical protein n=1 Tax=Aeromonas caviae TaxID=648 RepID=UPI0038CFAA67
MRFLFIFLMVINIVGCNGGSSPENNSLTPEPGSEYVREESFELVEGQKHTLKPYIIEHDFDDMKWTQTCGVPILKDDDSSSLTIDFLAPESDQDETYCIDFTGSHGKDKYIKSYKVTVTAPTLEVYIDHASLPTLQQLMHIVRVYDKNNTTQRFVSWARIKLTEKAKDDLNIKTFPLKGNNTSPELISAISNYIENMNRVNVQIFSNTAHSFSNISPIIRSLSSLDNAKITKIELSDDGSAEYMNLFSWKNTANKLEQLTSGSKVLSDYLDGQSDIVPEYPSSIYGWHKLYNADYLFLRKDYLDVEGDLHELRDYLGGSLKQMAWDQFSTMSSDKQKLLLSIVGFDKAEIEQQYNSSPLPNFIFTGTTTWSGGETREFYAKQQVNVINNAINETSPYYIGEDVDLFFKGHPRGGDINDYIVNSFSDIKSIPSNISFEILMMTGMLPDKIAGIASSLYFTIPGDKVDFIVFTSTDDIADREAALKSPLVQVMLKLNIVKESNILFWSDLPNCETGVCV